MKTLRLSLALISLFAITGAEFSVTFGQNLLLRSEYIRLGDRILAVENPLYWFDDFNRPQHESGLGTDWTINIGSPNSSWTSGGGYQGSGSRVQMKVGIFSGHPSNVLKLDHGGQLNATDMPGTVAIPIGLQTSLNGQHQFGQIKYVGDIPSSGTPSLQHTFVSVCAMWSGTLSPVSARAYCMEVNLEEMGRGIRLVRIDSGNVRNFLGLQHIPGLATGDVLRISVNPLADRNVIAGKRNGTPIFNYEDTDAGRVPAQGSPAVWCWWLRSWNDGADEAYFDDFAAGSGN